MWQSNQIKSKTGLYKILIILLELFIQSLIVDGNTAKTGEKQ